MKKVFFLLAAVILCGVANAQYYYYSYTPWDGNKAYSLNVGTDFSIVPRNFGEASHDISVSPGIAASFRYEGDKNISEKLSWGYQVEASYLSLGYGYQTDIEATTTEPAMTQIANVNWWDGQLDLRLSFSYWLNDNIELQLAAGVYSGIVYGISGEKYKVLKGTETEVAESRETLKGGVNIFDFDMGVSTLLQCKYFFNENFFVSMSLRDNIGVNFFGDDDLMGEYNGNTGQRGIVMLGVGYKFIK